jgi:UPF0148 protein
MDSSRSSDVGPEGKSDMKDAVSFLLKGGSLLSAPCVICSGVQIKYKDEIICINCEKQQPADEIAAKAASEQQVSKAEHQSYVRTSYSAHTFGEEIEERIAEHFRLMKNESSDLNNEKQRIKLIGMYFDLLDRLRDYSNKIQKQ